MVFRKRVVAHNLEAKFGENDGLPDEAIFESFCGRSSGAGDLPSSVDEASVEVVSSDEDLGRKRSPSASKSRSINFALRIELV